MWTPDAEMEPQGVLDGCIPFAQAVAGHPGDILIVPQAPETLIKRATSTEASFYRDVLERAPAFSSAVMPHVEVLGGEGDGSSGRMLLRMENLTAGLAATSVVDIKLGTTLFDFNATSEKRERLVQQARSTTAERLGIKVSAFDTPRVKLTRPCGRLIREESSLSQAMDLFFSNACINSNGDNVEDGNEKKVVDTLDDLSSAEHVSKDDIRDRYRSQIMERVIAQVQDVFIPALREAPVALYSCSLLIVCGLDPNATESGCEGDGDLHVRMRLIDFAHSYIITRGPSGSTEDCILKMRSTIGDRPRTESEVLEDPSGAIYGLQSLVRILSECIKGKNSIQQH